MALIIISIIIATLIIYLIYFWHSKPAAPIAPIAAPVAAPITAPTSIPVPITTAVSASPPLITPVEPTKHPLYDWNGTYSDGGNVTITITKNGDQITFKHSMGPTFTSQFVSNNEAGFMLFAVINQGTEIFVHDHKTQTMFTKTAGNTNPIGTFTNDMSPPTNSPWNGRWALPEPDMPPLDFYRRGNVLDLASGGFTFAKLPIDSNNEVTMLGDYKLYLNGNDVVMIKPVDGNATIYVTRIP